MPIFYVVLNANDSIESKNLIPSGFKGKRFALAVEADNEHDARAFIQASYAALSREKNFGEVHAAIRHLQHGWILDLPD